jgi:hypothetical protein
MARSKGACKSSTQLDKAGRAPHVLHIQINQGKARTASKHAPPDLSVGQLPAE